MDRKDIGSLNLIELETEFKETGLKAFRAKQVFEWLTKGAECFDEMTNLSKQLRSDLSDKYFIPSVKIKRKFVSKIDGTVKYLFELYDGQLIESVVMKYRHGYSQCLSTQAGCRMNCSFCATGKGGFKRNLLPFEMLSQITAAQKDLGIRISNLVLMGMGEPLDNFDNTVKFLKLVTSENGLNIGARHISLSTCGIVDNVFYQCIIYISCICYLLCILHMCILHIRSVCCLYLTFLNAEIKNPSQGCFPVKSVIWFSGSSMLLSISLNIARGSKSLYSLKKRSAFSPFSAGFKVQVEYTITPPFLRFFEQEVSILYCICGKTSRFVSLL